MPKLKWLLTGLFISQLFYCNPLFAFKDEVTLTATSKLIQNFKVQTSPRARLWSLHSYKDFLFHRLNTIEIPNLESADLNDPQLEEYSSLTEYDTYIELINIKELNPKSCASAFNQMNEAGSTPYQRMGAQDASFELQLARQVIKGLCQ